MRRQSSAEGVLSHVLYSRCETYRYSLTRTWDPGGPRCLWILLNPSTADARRNDPTVERCERRARAMGFGAVRVVNLFAFRATSPADLRRAAAPEGPANGRIVLRSVTGWAGCGADLVICGWGTHGAHLGRGPALARRLAAAGRPLHHLGLTAGGHPRHPLYVGYDRAPVRWAVADLSS